MSDAFTAQGFEWRDQRLEFFDHPHNGTITNERAVEIPIAQAFLDEAVDDGADQSILEVGNVLTYYADVLTLPGRVIVDRYEDHSSVTLPGIDVFALHGPFDVVVSISTVEHVRWDELGSYRNPYGGLAAFHFLRGLVSEDGAMLVTFPLGYSPPLNAAVMDCALPVDEWMSYLDAGQGWYAQEFVGSDELEAIGFGDLRGVWVGWVLP